MRKQLLLLASFFFISTIGFAQKLTLQELINICARQNWESVNTILTSKGWEYYESKKGDSDKYNTITWSYNKQEYNDKAQGWFRLYTYEGLPNKVMYSVFNKPAYNTIVNAMNGAGFKLIGSAIEDNELISTYSNNAWVLKINTEKREDDDWSDRSLTAYTVTVIRKSGIYDPNNGKKSSYYEDGELASEYTLKDGEFHGLLKTYYRNGQLKKQGTFVNGQEAGKFTEYDSLGNKAVEYTMADGKPNGVAVFFKEGKKSIEKTFVNGEQTGKYAEYYYEEETGALNYKIIGSTLNGNKNGKWVFYYVEDGKEEMVEYHHYKDDVKHGEVKEYIGSENDTLEIATYSDGILNGPYRREVKVTLYDLKDPNPQYTWVNDCEGNYSNGLKSGKWIYYDFVGKASEGLYVNDLKEGNWTYFVTVGNRTGEILQVSNYVRGEKNGLEKRFFFIDEIDDTEGDEVKSYYHVYPVQMTATYKNDLLNGNYELKDSTGVLMSRGAFLNDEKHGRWVEGYDRELPNGNTGRVFYEGEYSNGREEGKWVAYFNSSVNTETLNFKEGQLHGEYIVWNNYGKPSVTKVFSYGNMVSLTTFDSAGEKPLTKYDIYNETSSSLICRQTEYFDDKIVSQEYRIFRQEKIHHNNFEKVFLNLTGITSSGIYGYKDGEFKVITPKGDLLTKGAFMKENKIGLWAYHYPEQGVVLEQNYASGQPVDEKYKTLAGQPFSGEFVYHDTSAGLKEERKVKDGVRNGKTTYLDKNNKTIKKENYKDGVLK